MTKLIKKEELGINNPDYNELIWHRPERAEQSKKTLIIGGFSGRLNIISDSYLTLKRINPSGVQLILPEQVERSFKHNLPKENISFYKRSYLDKNSFINRYILNISAECGSFYICDLNKDNTLNNEVLELLKQTNNPSLITFYNSPHLAELMALYGLHSKKDFLNSLVFFNDFSELQKFISNLRINLKKTILSTSSYLINLDLSLELSRLVKLNFIIKINPNLLATIDYINKSVNLLKLPNNTNINNVLAGTLIWNNWLKDEGLHKAAIMSLS
jgi:hypothetical protein